MSGSSDKKKKSVMFVCLGNICRSPTAEAVFRNLVEKQGKADLYEIDSCGTGGGNPDWYMPGGWSYHEGEDADRRMQATATKRGIRLTSKSRPLTPEDVEKFDLLVGMDQKNLRSILVAADAWGLRDTAQSKLALMTQYCEKNQGAESVPDPYYGGERGFEVVLDLLQDACEGLYASMEGEQQ